MSMSDSETPTGRGLDQFVEEAVRILGEGFIPEVAERQLVDMGLAESEVSVVVAKAEYIAKVKATKDEKEESEEAGRGRLYGLFLVVFGVVLTVGSYVLAIQFGFPAYYIYFGLIAVGIWKLVR